MILHLFGWNFIAGKGRVSIGQSRLYKPRCCGIILFLPMILHLRCCNLMLFYWFCWYNIRFLENRFILNFDIDLVTEFNFIFCSFQCGRVEEITVLLVLSIWKNFGCCCSKDTQASRTGMGLFQWSHCSQQCCETNAKLPILWKTNGNQVMVLLISLQFCS